MHKNEIRDYIERAPRKWYFRDGRMVNTTHMRLKWLADIARGTLDTRINRRAGIVENYKPWHNPTHKAVCRNQRKLAKATR